MAESRSDRLARVAVAVLVVIAAVHIAAGMARGSLPAEPDYPRLVAVEDDIELLPPASWEVEEPGVVTTTAAPSAPAEGAEQLIVAAFARFGADVAAKALDVARCESVGLDPHATGSEGERGLFQIHPAYHQARIARLGFTWDQMYEVGPNIAVAEDLYAEQGWGPWTCAG